MIPFANHAQERLFNGVIGAGLGPVGTMAGEGLSIAATKGIGAAKSAYPVIRQQLAELAQKLRGSSQGAPRAGVGQDRSVQLGLSPNHVSPKEGGSVSPAAPRVGSTVAGTGGREGYTVFYHGAPAADIARIRAEGIDPGRGRFNADFGHGFYMSRSKADALWSAGRKVEHGEPIDVVEFRIPNSELEGLSTLDLGANMDLWRTYIAHHKNLVKKGIPKPDLPDGIPMHDVRTGPLYRKVVNNEIIPYTDRSPQFSIHSSKAVDMFNKHRVKSP